MKWLCLIIVGFAVGCVSDDFNNMAESFSIPTPREAADMAERWDNPELCRRGIIYLANSPFGGAPSYLNQYRDFIGGKYVPPVTPIVRAASIKALARFGTGDDALIIEPWLSRNNTDSEQVRRAAAIALQRLHNTKVVFSLLRSLEDIDESPQVRSAVATALGQYPERKVFDGLIAALMSTNLSINLSAAQSLHNLTGQVFGTDWEEWYEWGELVKEENNNLFAFQLEYNYPTYQYIDRWWDKLIFWEYRIHEKPGIPAGLEDPSARTTYEEDVETSK
ncbi:MAG: HEAT repeat domain-containing protein [Phycisphaerales bacterium]|jgi:hypothetical protein|nr:HEAT repeat domain-containing protein [Phycisphaerales bacterium]